MTDVNISTYGGTFSSASWMLAVGATGGRSCQSKWSSTACSCGHSVVVYRVADGSSSRADILARPSSVLDEVGR
jgi:hypothetical protein